jgi:hypothetical protein
MNRPPRLQETKFRELLPLRKIVSAAVRAVIDLDHAISQDVQHQRGW